MRKLEKFMEWGGVRKDAICLAISGVALLLSIFNLTPFLPFDIAWASIILCGVPIILEAFAGLVSSFDIKADVLVSMALIASVCIHEDFAAGEVAFIMQLGGLLENLTVAKARAGIEKLTRLTPTTARRLTDGLEETIPAEEVKAGDFLKVLPGETIPVDGVITAGQTSINEAVTTGESLPADKTVGDEVFSGSVNQFGAFEMKATKVGEDSSIQRMIRLVQSADAGKAEIVRLSDRWATWIVVIALVAAVLTWLITEEIIRAVTILVVFCPCSLILATPTAIMASIGNAAKHGFLVREGDALERLAKVKKIAFDKTGTLTVGVPKVTCVKSLNNKYPTDALYRYAAAIEKNSEHPLGKAVVSCWKKEKNNAISSVNSSESAELPVVTNFETIPGYGVKGTVNGLAVVAGNAKLADKLAVKIDEKSQVLIQEQLRKGSTAIVVAINGELAGFLALADSLRKESASMIRSLNSLQVAPVLLTGDNEAAANQIASELGIRDVFASCLPEDKLSHIDNFQRKGEPVCMVGDGVNDAPALKKSTVGIAMGGVGSDIAVNAADITLIDDEIKELPHLLALSRKTTRKIIFNLSFSLTLNFIAIVLAIIGILNPIVGALVHNCGSVFVVVNSAFLLAYKQKNR